jgi:hypothetical protein
VAIAVALGAGLGVFAVLAARTATLRRVAVSSTRFDAVGSAPEVSPTQPALSSAPVPTWPAAPSAPTAPAWPAARTAVVTPPAPYSIQVRGEAALRRLSYPYQQLGYTVTFLPGVSGYFGRGFHEQRRIEIYVRSGESDEALAHVVAHEIGHAIDWMYHTPSRDHEWLQLRGVDPSTEWAPCPFCTDFGAPSGDFAESFALWQLGNTDFRSTLAARPTSAQLQQLAHLFYP